MTFKFISLFQALAIVFSVGAIDDGTCYSSNMQMSVLAYAAISNTDSNSPTYCVNICSTQKQYTLATLWKNYCFCGTSSSISYSTVASSSQCNIPCSGNSSTMCGGGSYYFNVHNIEPITTPATSTPTSPTTLTTTTRDSLGQHATTMSTTSTTTTPYVASEEDEDEDEDEEEEESVTTQVEIDTTTISFPTSTATSSPITSSYTETSTEVDVTTTFSIISTTISLSQTPAYAETPTTTSLHTVSSYPETSSTTDSTATSSTVSTTPLRTSSTYFETLTSNHSETISSAIGTLASTITVMTTAVGSNVTDTTNSPSTMAISSSPAYETTNSAISSEATTVSAGIQSSTNPFTLVTTTYPTTVTTYPTTVTTNSSTTPETNTLATVNSTMSSTTVTSVATVTSNSSITNIYSTTVESLAIGNTTSENVPSNHTTVLTTIVTSTTAGSEISTNGAFTTANLTTTNPSSVTITTPGPTTIPPIVLPESNVSYLYPYTTSSYYGDLTTFNSTSGAVNGYGVVNGVIGFGSGISLNKNLSQCMNKSPFATNQSCLTNPDRCPNGLSFSLWTLVLYDNSVYDMTGLSDADNQYMVSTGADRDGHPGVAIGIKKQWMFALVSTGSQYWYTEILGQLQNNTWNNVGVRFSPSMGLEVYVNCTKVGSTTIINTATAKPTYAIPTLLIGCQKTASDSNYSGYFNGYCDEIAIWDKLVPVTNNLSLNFFGGYSANTSNISPAEFASMLANIQINNPGQQAAAVKILTQLTATSTAPTPAPTATQGNVVSGSVASPTSAGSTAETVTTPAPANVQSLKTIGTILMNMMDPTRLPEALTPEQASSFLQLSESFSNVLGPDNSANWLVVQNQTETVGVMQLVHQFRAWHSKLMQSITYTNESKPLCNEIVNKNVYIKYCKMTVCDFGILDKRYTVPDYSKPSLKEIRNLWKDTVTDRIAFPTQIFPDDRCCDRPVSFIFHYYGFADQAAVSIANPMYVASNAYTSIDARIMNLDIVSDLPYDSLGNVDTKEPLCNYDAEALLEQQLLFKSSHMDTNDAMITPRKLLLFENQTVTDIQERFCVYWNENLTDYGAWDSPLCGMVVDTGEYSKCACSNVGIFTILAVKTEPIVVPKQSQWVYLIKYIFYGLSIFAVIIYITVVLMSGELKDQFHLVGLHLAIAILVGSIAMVISDFAAVKDDRNTCTMVGTFIHIFYGAVGTWILFLGHASFNAITSGIIGGRLLSYSTIAWGIPLAFAGVPFITMLSLMGYDPYCFIGWDNLVKWVFFAPQMACALIASFFAIVILCNLSTPALRKENLIKDYGTFSRGAALLILYLSITWTFGLVAHIRFGIAIDFYPIFQVLNSLSGVCLLVLIGFGSERFRSTLAGKTQSRRAMLRQFAFGLPNSDDIRGPKKWQSNNPSAASTSTLIPEESKIPSEEIQAY